MIYICYGTLRLTSIYGLRVEISTDKRLWLLRNSFGTALEFDLIAFSTSATCLPPRCLHELLQKAVKVGLKDSFKAEKYIPPKVTNTSEIIFF